LDDQKEVELLTRVVAGDVIAFEQLYRAYHPRLWRFVERITHRPHLVEEILNDTMLVVWRRPHTFNGECRLSTWVFAIAFNKAIKAVQRVDDPVQGPEFDDRPSEAVGPEGQLMAHQRRLGLQRALATLPLEQRAVVELTYFHEFAYREIAEVLSCPMDTVKTRMFHARRKLKVLLGKTREDIA
jgi:RNA polymerase sigma-70 factor (ECF subfamily)